MRGGRERGKKTDNSKRKEEKNDKGTTLHMATGKGKRGGKRGNIGEGKRRKKKRGWKKGK